MLRALVFAGLALTAPPSVAPGSAPVFTQVAAGPSGVWATDYEKGVLYRVRVP